MPAFCPGACYLTNTPLGFCFCACDALHCSGFGHDKSQAILPYRQLENPPTIFFFGDGVSGECSARPPTSPFFPLTFSPSPSPPPFSHTFLALPRP